MTLEALADLIHANGGNTKVNATLMNIQNDFTDVRGDIKALKTDVADIRRSLDLATVVVCKPGQRERGG